MMIKAVTTAIVYIGVRPSPLARKTEFEIHSIVYGTIDKMPYFK